MFLLKDNFKAISPLILTLRVSRDNKVRIKSKVFVFFNIYLVACEKT